MQIHQDIGAYYYNKWISVDPSQDEDNGGTVTGLNIEKDVPDIKRIESMETRRNVARLHLE